MNISAMPINMSQIDTSSFFGVAMLSKALDSAEMTGDAMVAMMKESMELSVTPHLGGNVDIAL